MTSHDWAPTPNFTREWLIANGLGGFASGTIAGAVTRRYHAFLCAAPNGPQERFVLVTKIEETLEVGEEHFPLSANIWDNSVSPRGDLFLESFCVDPFPRWIYRVPTAGNPVRIEKLMWMPDEVNATIVRYKLLSGDAQDVTLHVRPFLAPRDYHSSHHANSDFNTSIRSDDASVTLTPYSSLPSIRFDFDGLSCGGGQWYYGFNWPIERERGLDTSEDAYSPGYFALPLAVGEPTYFSATIEDATPARTSLTDALERRQKLTENSDWLDTENRLKLAADQFIVKRTDGLHTVLAGYPWFTDWGRDTMIALPGLCLETKRFDVAASILKAFVGAMDKGLIPNRFPERNETPDYNTVDGTLWMFHAVGAYARASGDMETVRALYPKLAESIEWHLAGTMYGIKADDDDGLLQAGDAQTQLTWMDAKIGDTAFTPRWGKPVEIQALWFNALMETAHLARQFNDPNTAGICIEWGRKVAASFPDAFWNSAEGCLYDYINSEGKDGSVRPNQALVVSLPHRLLPVAQESSVIACVAADLITPHGLRTLSPRDSRYRGRYEGDQWARDSAYHQGTAWAWPIGAFLEGFLRVNGHNAEAKMQVRAWLAPLIAHLDEAGLGSISEIFDGDAPNEPRGCFAQAWSVSEVLRLWHLSA